MFTILQCNLGELISSLYVKLLTYFLEEPEKWLLRPCITLFIFFLPFSAAKVLSHVAASAVGGWPVVVGLTFQSAAFP